VPVDWDIPAHRPPRLESHKRAQVTSECVMVESNSGYLRGLYGRSRLAASGEINSLVIQLVKLGCHLRVVAAGAIQDWYLVNVR
jgi:hypothetical protein